MKRVFFSEDVDQLIRTSLSEDIGTGDITTLSVIDPSRKAYGRYIAKESGVLCGMDIVEQVYHTLDESVVLTRFFEDGARFCKGAVVLFHRGKFHLETRRQNPDFPERARSGNVLPHKVPADQYAAGEDRRTGGGIGDAAHGSTL